MIPNPADVAIEGFRVNYQEDILVALLGAGAKYSIQQRIDAGLTERATGLERAKLRVYTALLEVNIHRCSRAVGSGSLFRR